MTISWPLSRQQVLDADGRPVLDVRAYFYVAGTSAPIAVYADSGLAQPLPWPVVPDAAGRFPRVYFPEGTIYRELMLSLSIGTLWNDDGIGALLPADDSSSGGGG